MGCVVASRAPLVRVCALTGNRAGDRLGRRLALSLVSHTSQGDKLKY